MVRVRLPSLLVSRRDGTSTMTRRLILTPFSRPMSVPTAMPCAVMVAACLPFRTAPALPAVPSLTRTAAPLESVLQMLPPVPLRLSVLPRPRLLLNAVLMVLAVASALDLMAVVEILPTAAWMESVLLMAVLAISSPLLLPLRVVCWPPLPASRTFLCASRALVATVVLRSPL